MFGSAGLMGEALGVFWRCVMELRKAKADLPLGVAAGMPLAV
jgi:hypothetical protein